MKKLWLLPFILGLLAILTIPVFAAEGETEETGTPDQNEVIYYFPEDLPDSDELFAGYVNQVFYGNGRQNDNSVPSADASAYPVYTGAKGATHDLILSYAKKVASGKLSSTVFSFTSEQTGESGKYYIAKDLGVSSVRDGYYISDDAYDAMIEKGYYLSGSIYDIVYTLMTENPYEFYWFDKTCGMMLGGGPSLMLTTYNGEDAVYVGTGTYQLTLFVAAGYSSSGERGTTTADTAKTSAASKSATNAKKIVSTYADYGDLEKLTAYKDKICSLVEYNYDALSGVAYGDPWQLIWVFDNDPDTNVVCEGYSKAFQYLCDLSTFNSSTITCVTVTGYMSTSNGGGGGHMWNIVKMDDGRNYIVDVTNVDGSSIGAGGSLFLGIPSSRSGLDTNVFTCYGYYEVTYQYYDDTMEMFDPKGILLLSEKEYGLTWSKPSITTQPADQATEIGETVTFKVVAKNALFYQWEYSKDGGKTWVEWEGKTKASVSVKGSKTNNGCLYRCKVTNSAGTRTSQAATLTVGAVSPTITTQPKDQEAALGGTVTFKVTATNATSYQWQYKKVGGSWKTWSGKTSASVSVTASSTNDGCLYRCIVKNANGSVTSESAKLTVYTAPEISSQPADRTVGIGNSVVFSVVSPNGTSFQWEYSKNNGKSWVTWKGKTGSTVTVTGSTTNNGCLYRCIVTNPAGSVTSNTARLTVIAGPEINSQPDDITVEAGNYAYFYVNASDVDSYQWQVSKDGGSTWKNISKTSYPSAATDCLSFIAKTSMDQYQYRCVMTNSSGTITSNVAVLTVYEAIVIQQEPEDTYAYAGDTVSFSVYATGSISSYQWQVSKDGGSTWKNVSVSSYPSAATATLTFTMKNTMDGFYYRCVIKGADGTYTSLTAQLTLLD